MKTKKDRSKDLPQSMSIDEMIVDIIQQSKIRDQQELAQALEKRRVVVPQPTLSRKLKKLGVGKMGGFYAYAPHLLHEASALIEARIAPPNLIVLITKPGYASVLAEKIDHGVISGEFDGTRIIGTLAGENTIFVAINCRLKADLEEIKNLFDEKFG